MLPSPAQSPHGQALRSSVQPHCPRWPSSQRMRMRRAVSSSSTPMGLTISGRGLIDPPYRAAPPFGAERGAVAGDRHRRLLVDEIPHKEVLDDAAVLPGVAEREGDLRAVRRPPHM